MDRAWRGKLKKHDRHSVGKDDGQSLKKDDGRSLGKDDGWGNGDFGIDGGGAGEKD